MEESRQSILQKTLFLFIEKREVNGYIYIPQTTKMFICVRQGSGVLLKKTYPERGMREIQQGNDGIYELSIK